GPHARKAQSDITKRALDAFAIELQLRDARPVQIQRWFFKESDEGFRHWSVRRELDLQLLRQRSFDIDARRRKLGDAMRFLSRIAEIDATSVDLRIAKTGDLRRGLHAMICGERDQQPVVKLRVE